MSARDTPRDAGGAEDGQEDVTGSSGKALPPVRSRPESASQHWLILSRGSQRMVLFRGWPEAGVIEAFRRLEMEIGCALGAGDVALNPRFEDCGYAFIGADSLPALVFAAALRDLGRANWSIDQDASWPVITGGYAPDPTAERQSPATSPQQQDRPRRKLEKMEA